MKNLFILSLLLFYKINGQPIPDLCPEGNPFRLVDRSCHSFSEKCFKTGDEQCNQLLNACKQCPPSNNTLTILRNIWEISKLQSNFSIDDKIFDLIVKLTTTTEIMANKLNADRSLIIILSVIAAIIFIILIFLIFENRFKIFTKFIRNCKNKKTHKYSSIEKIPIESCYHPFTQGRKENMLKDIKKNIEDLSLKLSNHIYLLQNESLVTPQKTIKFPLEGIDHKYIELYVHYNHCIVHVKQRLCTSLASAMPNDYKKMKLKYNGKILNDNDYLLKYIDSSTNSVSYIIDPNINTDEIVVVKLKGKVRLPEIIQINKNETIENLFSIINDLIETRNFRVYKIDYNNKKMIELIMNGDKNKTVNDFHLTDGNELTVVTIEEGELILRSIFNENDSLTVKYQNIDRISTFLKDEIRKDFILFHSNEPIDENKFIFQFDVSNDSQIKFCRFKEFADIEKIGTSIHIGKTWEMYFATHKKNEKILIKKYDIKLENLKNEAWVLNELKTFIITKSHDRFIQLNDVYKDKTSFYISMENMPGGTLKYYLRKNREFDSVQVIKWAAQILEGLKFLHQNGIIHRDLNSSSILVGDKKDLKLSNFNLSKYDENGEPCSIMEKCEKLSDIKVRYMAPEILESKQYGSQCDVWSFGAVLVRIVTGKKPYPELTREKAQMKIIESGKIEYNLPELDVRIKSIIDSCLDKNPSSRCKIKDLVENEIIRNSLP